jgi:hypothetical protein
VSKESFAVGIYQQSFADDTIKWIMSSKTFTGTKARHEHYGGELFVQPFPH